MAKQSKSTAATVAGTAPAVVNHARAIRSSRLFRKNREAKRALREAIDGLPKTGKEATEKLQAATAQISKLSRALQRAENENRELRRMLDELAQKRELLAELESHGYRPSGRVLAEHEEAEAGEAEGDPEAEQPKAD